MCAPHPIHATYFTPRAALAVAIENGAVDAAIQNPPINPLSTMLNPAPSRAEVRRNARLRRADRKADSILFEKSRPIDATALLEADRRATILFNIALLLAFAAIVAVALFR